MALQNFCPIPFETVDIGTRGTYQICCEADFSNPIAIKNNMIVNNEGHKYHIANTSPTEIFNESNYIKIREQFLQNKKPEMCNRCWKKETVGSQPLTSRRQIELHGRYELNTESHAVYSKEMPASNIKGLILRLSNLCNLQCRMCNPYDSSKWLDDWNSVVKKTNALSTYKRHVLTQEEHQSLSNNDWSNNPKAIENIMSIASSLQYITFNGGEPTLVDAQYRLYDLLIEKDYAKNIILGITTNLTNVPRKLLSYISAFKKVIIMTSIDGFDVVNHYIRWPSNWKKIVDNLQIWKSVQNVQIELKSTIQMYNICNLDIFLPWVSDIGFNKIHLLILTDPICLNIQVLPDQLKEIVAKKLQPFVNTPQFQTKVDNLTNCSVQNIIDWMYGRDLSQYLNDFFAFTKIVDQHRNQDLLTIAPEFKPYLNVWYNYLMKLKGN